MSVSIEIARDPVPVELFAKDHWSLLAYAQHVAINQQPLDHERMRCDPDRHPLNANRANRFSDTKYPTRLKPTVEGETRTELADHDDWDCLEDLEAAGLLQFLTLMTPGIVFTPRGLAVHAELVTHKQNGGNFHGFTPSAQALAVSAELS